MYNLSVFKLVLHNGGKSAWANSEMTYAQIVGFSMVTLLMHLFQFPTHVSRILYYKHVFKRYSKHFWLYSFLWISISSCVYCSNRYIGRWFSNRRDALHIPICNWMDTHRHQVLIILLIAISMCDNIICFVRLFIEIWLYRYYVHRI